jgi:tyrosinase
MQEKRLLMIEMDKWIVTLAPGKNTIVRMSTDSNVTIPEERTFRSVAKPSEGEAQYRFCSCGWPHHMLLPKGSTSGVQFDLFVMISNIADDEVVQDIVGLVILKCIKFIILFLIIFLYFFFISICNDSHVFCGIRDKKYPDKRSMGFPFDRPLANIRYVNTVVKKF